MTDLREHGLQVFRELLPGAAPDDDSRRDRSLVTLGILIALRATDELKFHVQIARNNGPTEDEIAEVIYHAGGYAGLPAANTACRIARDVLEK